MTALDQQTESRIIRIDYSTKFRKLAEAGNYDYIGHPVFNRKIQDLVPRKNSEGQTQLELLLVHFAEDLSTDEVLSRLEAAGFMPATALELCALGAQHQELQLCFKVIALGSRFMGEKHEAVKVLSLCRYQSMRTLELCSLNNNWIKTCRFAAVRN